MGLVHSHHLLTQPVTLNRMRYVCQRNSKLPKQLQRFNIELLANDLNKLGFNIQLRDKRGKPLSTDKICNEIYMSRPDVEGVCMVKSGKVDSQGVAKLAKHFNKYYGTNIPLTVNPMDPSSPKRSIPELCDDLYLVSDKISRRLSDDVAGVKKKLFDSIDQLKMQQRVLDEAFGKHINSLKGVGHPEHGNAYDEFQKRVAKSTAIREAMRGELGRQIVYATKVANNLGQHLDSRFYPHIRHVQGVLDKYYHTPYDGSVRNALMQTNHLLSATKSLAVATHQCSQCYNKLGLSLDSYENAENMAEWANTLENALHVVRSNPTSSATDIANAIECYQKLLHSPGSCHEDMARADKFRGMMHGDLEICSSLDKDQCSNNQWCKMEGDNCVPDTSAAPFGVGNVKMSGLQSGGSAEDRAAFWVDADSADESEMLF